jgi:hypothetical protein
VERAGSLVLFHVEQPQDITVVHASSPLR